MTFDKKTVYSGISPPASSAPISSVSAPSVPAAHAVSALEGVHPIGFEVIDEENERTQPPGEGIRPKNDGDVMHEMHDDADVDDADETPAGEHDQHGHARPSRAAANARNAMRKGEQTVKQRFRARLPRADADDLLDIRQLIGIASVDKQRYQVRREQTNKHADELRHRHGAQNSEAGARFRAIELLRAEILPDEGGEGQGKGSDGQKGKPLHAGVAAAARHGIGAEYIDVRLHHDVGEGDDGILHPRREPVAEDLPQHVLVKADFFQRDPIDVFGAQKLHDAKEGRYALGYGGRRRGGTDAHPEASHEQQVQHDVEQRRKNQIIQGMPAVAHRLQNADRNVVEDDRHRAEKVNPEIGYRLRKHIFGRAHQPQQRGGEQNARPR